MKHHKYFKLFVYLFLICNILILVLCTDCEDSSPLNFPNPSGVVGQVFNLSHPGPIPIGWMPPPLNQVSTIRVFDINNHELFEKSTHSDGSFQINVQSGTYYFSVKESPIQSKTGPVNIRDNERITIQVFYDNGMR